MVLNFDIRKSLSQNILQSKKSVILLCIFLFFSCSEKKSNKESIDTKAEIRIAFLSDVHLLNIKGSLEDVDYRGIKNPKTGEFALLRTMGAQLRSTRLFNENYFAFLAALDDVVEKGIKLVALPGDFSDDGQPVNIRGLNKILNEYSEKHDLSFFLTTGNHDPTRPFGDKGGKADFLGLDGKAQPIMSNEGMYRINSVKEHPLIVSDDIGELGYNGIISGLKHHGFFPKKEYLHWQTPFSKYEYENYSFEKAVEASRFKNREYVMLMNKATLPDVSYLVEPLDGLWLLALDANVYLPKGNSTEYQGAGIGYNQVLEHKKHLIIWVAKVAMEAKRLNKTLIAFSHYPMIDFNDGASEEIRKLLGEGALQAHRIPDEKVAQVFADAGLKIHFGGHMHLNDTGIRTTSSGNTLVNIQTPSLAAYKPAYKIATISAKNTISVATVVLDSVPQFDEFFRLYEQEHTFLASLENKDTWNKNILSAKNYNAYTNWHFKELLRLRFLPEDWPQALQKLLLGLNGQDLVILSQTDSIFSMNDLQKILEGNNDSPLWKEAKAIAEKKINQEGLQLQDFKNWDGFDFIFDFYRLRNADQLAIKDIGADRLRQYEVVHEFIRQAQKNDNLTELKLFGSIFTKQLNGAPAGNFKIDLENGKVIPY